MTGLRPVGDLVGLMIAVLDALLLLPALVDWFSAFSKLGIAVAAMIFLAAIRLGGMQVFRAGGFDTLDNVTPRAADIALNLHGPPVARPGIFVELLEAALAMTLLAMPMDLRNRQYCAGPVGSGGNRGNRGDVNFPRAWLTRWAPDTRTRALAEPAPSEVLIGHWKRASHERGRTRHPKT